MNLMKQKVVFLGDSSVGKTSIINQYVNNKFTLKYKATVGVDLSTKLVAINDTIIQLQIWDPSGTERFRSINESFFRGTDGYILACSLTSMESFENYTAWMNDINSILGTTVPFVAVANKADIDEVEWIVSRTRFENWCAQQNVEGYYVSAKDNLNIEKAFSTLTEKIMEHCKMVTVDDSLEPQKIDINEAIKKSSGCC